MNLDPHWTSYLSALLAPTVAVLGSFIAYRQWRLAQNKLKFDLFDRRLAIYEAATTLISSIATSGEAKDEELFKFLVATREAKWLLDTPIAEYLDTQIYHKVIDLQTLQAELHGMPAGETRTKGVQAKAEIKKWLVAQYKVLDSKFEPYLKLQH